MNPGGKKAEGGEGKKSKKHSTPEPRAVNVGEWVKTSGAAILTQLTRILTTGHCPLVIGDTGTEVGSSRHRIEFKRL